MTALRDATLATLFLCGAIYAGSSGLAHLDPALLGYLGATLSACFVTVHRLSAVWRRPAAAFYARALLRTLAHPRQLWTLARATGRDLAAQRFLARRSRARWLAHLLVSGGTLAGLAITLPLVWGCLHFEADGARTYQAILAGMPVVRFATDGAAGWLVFHALDLAAGAVVLGAAYFLVARLRARGEPAARTALHLRPLLVLLAVALSGLALPVAGRSGVPGLFGATAILHELAVIVLLLAIPSTKLMHLLIRPLHLGAQLVRASTAPTAACALCGAPLAPAAQGAEVESLLARRGFRFEGHQHRCPPCRRRQVAAAQAGLLEAEFQPRPASAHERPKAA
jgi:hypothetical protein